MGAVTPKLTSYSEFFSNKIAEACIQALPRNHSKFDVEYVRVTKILGGSLLDSFTHKGVIV
jgi:T-complex protein 1 subunit theta